ncbi:hypothetical protein AgCh_033368 [Apium graveolens]
MGAIIPAWIQPGSIDHVPFPTVVPCLGASLALREKTRRRKPGFVGRSTLWQDQSLGQTNPPPRRIGYVPPIPIERKSFLVIPRLQHVRSLTPRAAAAVSRTHRRLTCTGWERLDAPTPNKQVAGRDRGTIAREVTSSDPFVRNLFVRTEPLAESNPVPQDPISAIHPPCIYAEDVASSMGFGLCRSKMMNGIVALHSPPMRKDAAEKNGTLFRSAGCVGSRITSELFTLKFKHVGTKCYPALLLRSNRSLLMLLRRRFFALSSLWTGALLDTGGSRRSVSFVMERKIPLLRLFVGPPTRTQWIEKLEYVIDSPKPTEPASDAHNDEHVVYRKWIDDANVAQCIMLASMNIELQKQHEHMDAHTILMHLQELYDVAGRTARYEISKELFGCRMSEGSSVNNHVLKMINLIERLGQLSFSMDGELSQDLVLQSLPSSFSQFVVNFHMNKLDVSLPELHNMLKTGESNFPPKKSFVLLIGEGSNPTKRKRNPSKKKKVGEKTPVPPKAEDPKSKVVCFHCNKVGHWKRNCKVYLAELKKKGSETTASDSVFLWGYALETSAYLLNKVLSKSVPQTPHATFLEKSLSLKETVGEKFELDEVQEAQTTTDQVETPVLTEQPFVEQPIHRSGRVSRQPERYYGLVIENDNELSIIDNDDPVTYNEAMSSVDSEKWHSAMKSRMKSMYTVYKR